MRSLLVGTIIALALPTLAAAQDAREERHTITVTASGTITREPDRATILLAVESFAATAREAADSNATRMQAVIAALRRLGLTQEQIRTQSYDLYPEYDYDRQGATGEERLRGYRARNMVRVTLDDVARVGQIIDGAIAAGANRVAGLNFELRDPAAARADALRSAVESARIEAEAIAAAIGRPLGPVISVNTGGPIAIPVPMASRMVMDAAVSAAPTPVEPGSLQVTATVTVIYRLEPR
ncbi:MAG TPA: SIMPL domain-containing protein [Longimicrobiales bacterium]|nr:SIMPL domain-containing protein [Longimicrobiales bacterium]